MNSAGERESFHQLFKYQWYMREMESGRATINHHRYLLQVKWSQLKYDPKCKLHLQTNRQTDIHTNCAPGLLMWRGDRQLNKWEYVCFVCLFITLQCEQRGCCSIVNVCMFTNCLSQTYRPAERGSTFT